MVLYLVLTDLTLERMDKASDNGIEEGIWSFIQDFGTETKCFRDYSYAINYVHDNLGEDIEFENVDKDEIEEVFGNMPLFKVNDIVVCTNDEDDENYLVTIELDFNKIA